jgi:hypothetical protein
MQAMSDSPVNLSAGLPETILPPPPAELASRLSDALVAPIEQRREAVSHVVADNPLFLDGWATLGDLARDDVEAYAAYRVGYHRGLDRLRANGWRGSGYVRWADHPNRGFLRGVQGLGRAAGRIGEQDEAERCAQFLAQLDPSLRVE